ncbi:hypothetical protein LguiB_026390 [Lonicera macranthoides]
MTTPPDLPIEGIKAQSLYLTPQTEPTISHEISAFFVSCKITMSGLSFEITSLMLLLFSFPPKPLTFQDKIFIDNFCHPFYSNSHPLAYHS